MFEVVNTNENYFYGNFQKNKHKATEIITGHPAAISMEPIRRKSNSIPLSIVNKKLAVSPYNVNRNELLDKEKRINYLKSNKQQATTAQLKFTLPTEGSHSIGSGLANTKSWKYLDKEQTTFSKISHFRVASGHFGKQTVSEYPMKETNTVEKSNERYLSSGSSIQPRNIEIPEHSTKTLTKQSKGQREIEIASPKYKHEPASLKHKKYKIIRSWTSSENQHNATEERNEEESNKNKKDNLKFKRKPLQTSETPHFVIAPNQNRNKPVGTENNSRVPFSVRQCDQSESSGKLSPRDTATQNLAELPTNISNDLSVYLHDAVRDVETSNKKIHRPTATANANLENNSSHEMSQNSTDDLKTREDLCEIRRNGENIIVQNREANRAGPTQDIERQGVKKGTQRNRTYCTESESEHNFIKIESETFHTQTCMPDVPTQSSGKAEEASGLDHEDFTLEHDPTIIIPGTGILQRLQAFSSALKSSNSETQTLKKKGTLEKASDDVLETIGVICAANIGNCEEFLVKNSDDYEKRHHHLRKTHKLRTLTNYILNARASKKLNDKLFLIRQLFMMLKFNDGSHLVQKRTLTEEQELNLNTGSSTPRNVKHQHTNRTCHRLSNASTETFGSSSSSKMYKTFKYSQVVQESLKAIYGFDLTNFTQKHVPLRRKSKSAMVGGIKNAEINQIEKIYTNITCNRRLFRNQEVTNCLPLSTLKDRNFNFRYQMCRPPSFSNVF